MLASKQGGDNALPKITPSNEESLNAEVLNEFEQATHKERSAKRSEWTVEHALESESFTWSSCWHRFPVDLLDLVFWYVDELSYPQHVACTTPCRTARNAKAQFESGIIIDVDHLYYLKNEIKCAPSLKSLTVDITLLRQRRREPFHMLVFADSLLSIDVARLALIDEPDFDGIDYSTMPLTVIDRTTCLVWLQTSTYPFVSHAPGILFPNLRTLTLIDFTADDFILHDASTRYFFPLLQKLVLVNSKRRVNVRRAGVQGEWWLNFIRKLSESVEIEIVFDYDALAENDEKAKR
jgi:hypothetical protein